MIKRSIAIFLTDKSGVTRWWNTCGWTVYKRNARLYSRGEAETVVRRMMLVAIQAKIAEDIEDSCYAGRN